MDLIGLSAFNPCDFYVKNMENRVHQFLEDFKFSWVQNIILGLFEELDLHLNTLGIKKSTKKDASIKKFENWKEDSDWTEVKIRKLLNSYGLSYQTEVINEPFISDSPPPPLPDSNFKFENAPEVGTHLEESQDNYMISPTRTKSSLVEKFDDIEEVGETEEETGRSSEHKGTIGEFDDSLENEEVIKLLSSSMNKKSIDFTRKSHNYEHFNRSQGEKIEEHKLNNRIHQ